MTTFHRSVAAIGLVAALLAQAAGCSNANRPLNPATLPLQDRVRNHTRAALFAQVTPPSAAGGDSNAPASTQPAPLAPYIGPDARTALAPADVDRLPPDSDGCFVGLALSGGGSRSANFSAACMFQLERLGLLQRVDYISAVSGGTLPAACYCVDRSGAWNPGAIQRELTRSFASELIFQTLLPWNLAAVAFTDYDRSDILAGIFQRHLFTRDGRPLTYADLRKDRPRLLLNATDLQSGKRFVFCNETFDQLNSDLSRYPLAYAVTASSAVPIVMHPVTLRDYSTIYPEYRHLIDGGITDNLGVETLVETFAAHVDAAVAAGRPDPYPKGAVLIVIDAHTDYNNALSAKSDIGAIESLKAAVGLSSTELLNRVSSATLADLIVRRSPDNVPASQLRDEIDRLNALGYLTVKDKSGHQVRVLYLALSQVAGLHGLPFTGFSETLNGIGTYFDIRDLDAYYLYQAADLLVRERFQGPLQEISNAIGGLDRASGPRP